MKKSVVDSFKKVYVVTVSMLCVFDWFHTASSQRKSVLLGPGGSWEINMEYASKLQGDLGPELSLKSMRLTMDNLEGQRQSGLVHFAVMVAL